MSDIQLQVFADRLKVLRSELNITQKDLAEKIGITAAALSSYENNLKNPSIAVVKRIAEAFDVSIDWLCGLTDKKKGNPAKNMKLTPGDIVIDVTKENYEKYPEYFNALFEDLKERSIAGYDDSMELIYVETGKKMEKEEFIKGLNSFSEDEKLISIQSVIDSLIINPLLRTVRNVNFIPEYKKDPEE